MNTNNTMYTPIFIKNYNIYDIFYNDTGNIIIIQSGNSQPIYTPINRNRQLIYNVPIKIQERHGKINNIRMYINNRLLQFNVEICPHNHTHIYSLYNSDFLYNENNIYQFIIDNEIIKTKINKYPKFENEIIMSTIVKNEDKYILQWINYHNKLGITRFIIYDNSTSNTLHKLLNKNINNIFILINWNYSHNYQQTQQNHSIYAFNKSKYIGLLDIDEYINLQEPYNHIDSLLNNFKQEHIGGFQLLNKFFYNPNHLPVDNYDFLKIYNCDTITLNGREKCFVIPKNVKTFSVHMITKGLPMKKINSNYAYFNHYIFLNKKNRGFNKTIFFDTSITRLTTLFNLY